MRLHCFSGLTRRGTALRKYRRHTGLHTIEAQSARCGEDTGVEKMQFRRLGDPFQRVRIPRLQCRNEEYPFEQSDVTLSGLVADVDAAAELRVVDQLPRMLCLEADELR